MLIRRLCHAQITIPKGKEVEARAFYCGVFELPEIEKPDSLKVRGGFWMHSATCKFTVPIECFDRSEFRDPFGNRVELIQPK